jgi:lipopolysaccharide export system permease protein
VLIVDRYIWKSFMGSYLLMLILGMGAYVLFDILGNMDEFAKNTEQSTGQMLAIMGDYYLHNLPLYFAQLSGPIMAFAGSFTLAMMLRNNELVALLAAGMPLPRLAAPILVGAVLIVAVWFVNREFLIPAWAEKIARTKDDVIGQRVTGIHCARDNANNVLAARRFHPQAGRLESVKILTPLIDVEVPAASQPSAGSQATAIRKQGELIFAYTAQWDEFRHTWLLEQGLRYNPDTAPLGLPIAEYPFGLAPEQLVLRRDAQWADLLSLRELNALVRSKNLANRVPIEMSRHLRVTQPLVQLLLLALALPFFLCRAPTNVLNAGGRALLISGVFFIVVFVASSVVRDSGVASFLAWLPILAFGPIAVMRLANIKT